MQSATSRTLALPVLMALLCSCAGEMSFRKEIELPEEQITLLAAQIEEVVLNTPLDEPTNSDFGTDPQTGEPLGDIDPVNVMVSMDEIRQQVPALAELNMDNEIVLTAIRGRILRRSAVKEFEQNSCIGENRHGLLEYLGGEWCAGDRHLRSRASYVVLTDNRDRRAIYDQVVEANGLYGSALGRIREIFAEQIYKKAWAGTPLQMPDGTWERR